MPLALISVAELFEAQGTRFEPRPDRFVSTFNGEDVVTSALIRLREGKKTKIAFTTGHDEPSTAELDPSRPGLGLWRARLASVGDRRRPRPTCWPATFPTTSPCW